MNVISFKRSRWGAAVPRSDSPRAMTAAPNAKAVDRMAPFATIRRMVTGDWPELEYLVIGTGVRVLRANEAVASISGAVQALNEATSALPQQANAGDVSKLAGLCAAEVAALEAAATAL